jgi:cell division septation protein DedD
LSESQEPSYYEIALTNRQVLVAFVVLLACVLLAFFAGVWVGKGSPAAATEAAEPAPEPTPVAGEPEELSFFNGGQRPDLPAMAENPRPDTTLAEDLGLEERPTPTPPPAPTARATATAAAPPPAPAQPADDGAADAAPALQPGEVVIQVFSSRDELQAMRLTTELKASGFRAFLSPRGDMFRVRIGPYPSRERAQADAQRARRQFKVDTWITGNP